MIKLAVVLVLALLSCARAAAPAPTAVMGLFSAAGQNAEQVANEILQNANNNVLSFEERQQALAVAIQQVKMPLIQQFKGLSAGRAGAAPGATDATTPAGTQLTQDQQIAIFDKFKFGLTLEQYRGMCNQDPTNRLACDPNFRALAKQDYDALLQARSMGLTLVLPFVPSTGGGDYAVSDPFQLTPSGLPKQLNALVTMKNGGGANSANDAASAAAAKQQADAKAAGDKAAADAAAAAAAKAAADKAAADAAASGDAAAAAAAKAAADKAAADAAAAAAAKAAADKAAADAAAAAAAAEAAKPKIKRVGGLLQTPTNRHTLYFESGESPTSIICVGGCLGFWTPADPSWANDPSTGFTSCSGFVRTDGNQQLQCDGKPLYTFVQDTAAGQAGGNPFNPQFQNA